MSTVFEKVDILAELPYLIRKILQAIVAKPFTWMWFDQAGIVIAQNDGKQKTFDAFAYHEITHINRD